MSSEYPFISLLIPTYNEIYFIRKTLNSILEQDYPRKKMEVLIIDGCSKDGTKEQVRNYQDQYPFIRILNNPKKFVAPGLNKAIKVAKGEIIIRIDAHTTIAKNYVRNCVKELESSRADNVGGRMQAKGNGYFGECVALATSHPFGVGNAQFHYSDERKWVDTVYMGAWRREVFDRIGYFDEELVRNQDDEFNYRLRKQGGCILLSPEIKSEYINRSYPKALLNQYFQYGFWKVRVLQKHPKQMSLRQFIPPIFSGTIIFMVLISFIYPVFLTSLAIVFTTYFIAALIASSMIGIKSHFKYIPGVMLSFVILHFSYGVGFLFGLLRFISKWSVS